MWIYKKLIYSLVFFCLVGIALIGVVSIVPKVLFYESKSLPSHIDAVVVLGGGSGERIDKSVALYNELGPCYIIMTSGPLFDTSFSRLMRDYAVRLGVPSSDILLESESFATKDHPVNIYPLLQDNDIKTLVVVTSRFHTGRARRVFKRFFNQHDRDISLSFVGADDEINYDIWWKNHEMLDKVGIELIKSVYYWIFKL